jgi:hypothetical protein
MQIVKPMARPEVFGRAPELTEAFDTTTSAFDAYVDWIDGLYRQQKLNYSLLDEQAREHGEQSFGFRVALKIAESRRIIRVLHVPLTITLVNPVYKETGRIQRRTEHPHGEDSIRYKLKVLRELESLNRNFSARFVVVDDECPHHSGDHAERILQEYAEEHRSGKYRVLYLGKAIEEQDPDVPPGLTHKDGENRSVKGGALLFGMRKAIDHPVEGLHVLVDNDADLSIHPAQLGILVEDILAGGSQAVAGSRRETDSVALIGGSRNSRGQLFIQIWQHFLPQLAQQISDTNRAFKAYTADALQHILYGIRAYTFPYQIELLQACVASGVPLSRRGIAYVDSEAASTQQGVNITETYLDQIRQIIKISRRYGAVSPDDALLRFFDTVSDEHWHDIETNPLASLEDLRSPTQTPR